MATIELSTLGEPIKTAYEGQPNTNAFTDAEKSKLEGIDAEATKNATDSHLLDRENHTGTQPVSSISGLADLLASKVDSEAVGASPGVAPLDASGLVPLQHINVSGLAYQGAWDPVTNTPTLADGIGTTGHFYKSSGSGSIDFGSGVITVHPGDWLIYAAGVWQRLPVHEMVTSVNGKLGDVLLSAPDVGARPDDWTPEWGDVTGKPDFPNLYQPKQRGIYTPAIPALNRFLLTSSHSGTSELRLSTWGAVYGYDQFGQLQADGTITMPSWAKLARISAHIMAVQSGVGFDVEIRRGSRYGKGDHNTPAVTPIMKVSSTDIFEIIVRITSGAAVSFHTASWLSIELYE